MVGIEILVHFIVLQSAIEKKKCGSIVRILSWLIFGRLKVKTHIFTGFRYLLHTGVYVEISNLLWLRYQICFQFVSWIVPRQVFC